MKQETVNNQRSLDDDSATHPMLTIVIAISLSEIGLIVNKQ